MEFKHIETFVVIMKEGSFAKAARKLGFAQSSLAVHIRLLEESMSVNFFEKKSRFNVPTRAAREFLPYAEELLALADNAQNAMLTVSETMRSEVTVAASEAVILSRELKSFIEEFPQASLKIKTRACMEVPGMLQEGEADLGYFIGEAGAQYPKLRLLKCRREPVVLVYSPAEEDGQNLSSLENIAEKRFIFGPDGTFSRKITEKVFSNWNRRPHTVEAMSVPAIKDLCAAGLGVAFMPMTAVEDELRAGMLRYIPWDAGFFGEMSFCPELKLAVPKNKTLTPAMTELCRYCQRAFETVGSRFP